MNTFKILAVMQQKYAEMQAEHAAAKAKLEEILAKTKSIKDQNR